MLQREEYLVRDLLEAGVIEESSVERAKVYAGNEGVSITRALVDTGATAMREIAIAQASMYECSFVDLDNYDIDLKLAARLPKQIAQKYTAFPLFDIEGVVTVGMADPMDFKAVDQIRARLGDEMTSVLCEPAALEKLIGRAYSLIQDGADAGRAAKEPTRSNDLTTGEEPIVAAVREIVAGAIDAGASDIHLSADQENLHLRYRVDGVLSAQQGPALSMHGSLVRRIKVLANLDLTQTRKPQDGKFRYSHEGKEYDLRCSIVPTICGESVVIRVLKPDASFAGFDQLGMNDRVREEFQAALTKPHGLILVTGPTGSGKTSTLYTALQHLNTPDRNIMTVEDPVEIRMPVVRQTQVNPESGLTFADALRALLRQDPDVILVGEIRDEETAHIAVQASMTGHLVLTTLHTNDAAGAIDRLRDLGAPAYAIAGSVLCAMAQRLVRRVCDQCAEEYTPSLEELQALGISGAGEGSFKRGAGCPACSGSGYSGRLGVYELMPMSQELQRLIHAGAGPVDLRNAARRAGARTMLEDGLDKARAGLTTLEELMRVRATISEDTDEGGTEQFARMSA